jgi:hypothetical protein
MSADAHVDFIKIVQDFSGQHLEHQAHISSLVTEMKKISQCAISLKAGADNSLAKIQKIQVQTILEILDDLNNCLLISLSNQLYSSVEALSRVALENTINLIFIAEGDDDKRAKSLLNSYATTSKVRAEQWYNYTVKVSDLEGRSRAGRLISYIDEHIKVFLSPFRNDKEVKGWSSARSRFEAVGLEHLYHILYAPSCNSIHSFSEDIYNVTFAENTPEILREEAFNAILAEKISFAYYLATNAVFLYAEAVYRLAIRLERSKVEVKILEVKEGLWQLVMEHEELTTSYEHKLQQ